MTYDFRTQQIRLNRIISSGSIPILIYPSSSTTNLQGGKTFPDPGSDVFLFVSGSSTAKTAFGGDVVVSSSFRVLGPITASIISGSKTDIPALQTNSPNSGALLITTPTIVTNSLLMVDGGGLAASNGGAISLWTGTVGNDASTFGPVFLAYPDLTNDNATVGTIGTFFVASGSSNTSTNTFIVSPSTSPDSSDVVLTGSLKVRGGITGSISGTIDNLPFVVAGPNITANYNSLGQWAITGSGGGGGGNIWIEPTSTFIYTTSSVGIKTTIDHANVDLFISGSDITGNGSNLVLYNDLSGFGMPRITLSGSNGALGGLIGYDNNINGLVDGINVDIPSTKNFGIRIGGSTAATTIDSNGNLNVRSGSTSTAYYDVQNKMVGIGTAASNLATSYTLATRLVVKDSDSSGNKYQLFISNEYPGTDLNSGIAFAFGSSNISGAIYAKTNDHIYDRKGLNALIPTGNSFSWRTAGAHLGELTDGGNLVISGSVKAYTGFTGSLSGTIGGLPFIIAGPNITASYNSLGQWAITGSEPNNFFYSSLPNIIQASGSLYITGSLRTTKLSASNGAIITGSFVNGSVGNIASGIESHAEGYSSNASGSYSHSEGYQTIASGIASHAEGYTGTVAIGVGSHAEGVSTQAFSTYSHTEGWLTVTSGSYSHAEGYKSETKAIGSHAEGYETLTHGIFSHAEGYKTVTVGDYSHAQGSNTVASGSNQFVAGVFNKQGNSTSLFIIGNDLNESSRSDVFRVNELNTENIGDLIVSGSVVVSGTLSASAITTMLGEPILKAGSNVVVNYVGGQYIISSSTAAGTEQWQDGSNKISTTSSVALAGEDGILIFANDYGSDVYFYVSGSASKRTVFKGDVVNSGSIYVITNGISSGYINSSQAGQKNYLNINGQNKLNDSTGLTAATGSYIRITAGSGSAVTGSNNLGISGSIGGGVEIFGGAGGNDLNVASGGGLGGEIIIRGGSGGLGYDGGSGGNVTIAGGNPNISTPGGLGGNGGNLFLKSGDGGSFDGTAGSIYITHGNKNGNGKDGFVYFKDNLSNVNISDDASFFVSGTINSKNGNTRGAAVFGGDLIVSGTVNLFGGKLLNPNNITANYSASLNDYLISVSSSTDIVVYLPTYPDIGRTYIIKDISGSAEVNKIKISASIGQLIDGLQYYTMPSNYASVEISYFGNNIWGII